MDRERVLERRRFPQPKTVPRQVGGRHHPVPEGREVQREPQDREQQQQQQQQELVGCRRGGLLEHVAAGSQAEQASCEFLERGFQRVAREPFRRRQRGRRRKQLYDDVVGLFGSAITRFHEQQPSSSCWWWWW